MILVLSVTAHAAEPAKVIRVGIIGTTGAFVLGPFVIRTVLKSRGIRAARRLEAVAAGRPIPPELVVQRE